MKKQKKSLKICGAHADNLFQKARLNAGLSQEKAAEKLSCVTRTLQRCEAGETEPDRPMMRRMIDAYKCEAACLILLAGEPLHQRPSCARFLAILSRHLCPVSADRINQ